MTPREGAFPREVGPSEIGPRRALAKCRVYMSAETTTMVAANTVNKGDVLGTARGAGIQADLKTFHQLHVYGAAAITLITVQNTRRVSRVEMLEAALVGEQIDPKPEEEEQKPEATSQPS